MKRALVTGAAGFIGSHLVEGLLARGWDVVAFDNLSTGDRANVPPAAQFVRGDVADAAAVEQAIGRGVDAVLHVAGQASIVKSFSEPQIDLATNVLGTINVLQGCVKHRVPRLVFASSMTVYGHPTRVPTPESEACVPVSYYGITKYAAERYVHATAARRDLDVPLAVTSFRMFNVYGPRQSLSNPYQGVLAIFIGRALRGEPITIHSDGGQARDLVHVTDVAEAWLAALDDPRTHGAVYNLGSGQSHSVNELADLALAAFGRSRADYPMLSAPAQPGDLRQSCADTTALRQATGWRPRVPFAEGMSATVRWAIDASRAEGPAAAAARPVPAS